MEDHSELPGSPGEIGTASAAPGVRGGTAYSRAALKRRQTLAVLIDELSNPKGNADYKERRDKGSMDMFVQEEEYEDPGPRKGAEEFRRFDKSINNLIQGVFTFQTAALQLGSSAGLVASASEICTRLHAIELLFHENAAELFPQIKSKVVDVELPRTKRRRLKNTRRITNLFIRPKIVSWSPDPETLPSEILGLAKGMKAFLLHLEEFPEFIDEELNVSITTFESDLTYRADCLEEYEDKFRWPSVQYYVHAISTEMTEYLQKFTSTIKNLVDNGIPAVRLAQQNDPDNLLFISTIAIFFSGVTATTAQFSYADTSTSLKSSVNLLFFGSLVLSISAAINSLLGLSLKRSRYRSPKHRVPWWVLIWTQRSPLVFMTLSVGLFSAGLVCFCYATQEPHVAMTVLVLTSFCSFGLLPVATWSLAERWVHSRYEGHRWLPDVIEDKKESFLKLPLVLFARHIPMRVRTAFKNLRESLLGDGSQLSDEEDGLPFSVGVDAREKVTPFPISYCGGSISGSVYKNARFSEDIAAVVGTSAADSDPDAAKAVPERIVQTPQKLKGASRFSQIAWKVAAERSKQPPSPIWAMSGENTRSGTIPSGFTRRRDTDEGSSKLNAGLISTLRPSLNKLQVTDTIWDHTALVRHLQFSPNGKILATCGWDGTARLFDVPSLAGDPVGRRNVMAAAGKSSGTVRFWGQAAWSPDGRWLLTKWMRGIQIWTDTGIRKASITRGKMVRSVAWLPWGQAFLSVEGSQVVEITIEGVIRQIHELDRLDLHDVTVTPDEERMLGVAILLSTKGGLRPTLFKAEKRIVVYNFRTKKIENLVPALDEVHNITISRNGQNALVSSEGKGAPQLFRLDIISNWRNGPDNEEARLVPVRIYTPKTAVEFAGASYFAGHEDEFIVAPTKSGDILFWEQKSGRLHTLRDKDIGDGDLTSVAWNYGSKQSMLASACQDGSVRIWTANLSERDTTHGKEREHAATASSRPYDVYQDSEMPSSSIDMPRRSTDTAETPLQTNSTIPYTYQPSMGALKEEVDQPSSDPLGGREPDGLSSSLPVEATGNRG